MADILDAAQSNTPAPPDVGPPVEPPPSPVGEPPEPPSTPSEPVIPPPPPATSTDSLIIPPPEEPITTTTTTTTTTQPVPPPPEKPKKKSRLGVLIAGLLILAITIPILTVFVRQQVEIRSRAAYCLDPCVNNIDCGAGYYCYKPAPPACPVCKPNPTPTGTQNCNTGNCYNDCVCHGIPPSTCGQQCAGTPTPTPGLPFCPNTDCMIPSTVPGAIHCQLSSGGNPTYCCPTNKPLYQNGQCVVLPPNCNTGNCYNDCVCHGIPPSTCGQQCAPTPAPITSTPTPGPFVKCCPKYNTPYSINTCTGASESGCNININYCIPWNTNTCPAPSPSPGTTPPPGGGGGNWVCNNGTGSPPPIPVACTNGGTYNGKCIIYHCPNGCGGTKCDENSPNVWWEYKSCSTAALTGNECGQIDTVTDAGRYCSPQTGCDVKALRCTGCSGGPTRPTTPTPPPQCINILVYRCSPYIECSPNPLTPSELAALHPGDKVELRFTAGGGAATKVRFRINSTNDSDWIETSTKNQNSQFVLEYTLTNTPTFTIEAQWFDGSAWH